MIYNTAETLLVTSPSENYSTLASLVKTSAVSLIDDITTIKPEILSWVWPARS